MINLPIKIILKSCFSSTQKKRKLEFYTFIMNLMYPILILFYYFIYFPRGKDTL